MLPLGDLKLFVLLPGSLRGAFLDAACPHSLTDVDLLFPSVLQFHLDPFLPTALCTLSALGSCLELLLLSPLLLNFPSSLILGLLSPDTGLTRLLTDLFYYFVCHCLFIPGSGRVPGAILHF